MRTSPMESLQENTPKSYMICPQMNLQRQLQIQLKFRGLSAKLHHLNFEKGSNEQVIITMQFIEKNYPKTIYGMGNFKKIKLTKFREFIGGRLQNWPSS